MSGRRVRVLADDQHPHLVERKGEGAQHIFSGRQISPTGRDLLAQELTHRGDVFLDGL